MMTNKTEDENFKASLVMFDDAELPICMSILACVSFVFEIPILLFDSAQYVGPWSLCFHGSEGELRLSEEAAAR